MDTLYIPKKKRSRQHVVLVAGRNGLDFKTTRASIANFYLFYFISIFIFLTRKKAMEALIPQQASGDAKILLSARNLIKI